MTVVMPPNDAPWQHYAFDQRNLMTGHSLSDSGVNPQLQATFTYDGAGNSLQQTDYTSSEPVTTTYTNDIVELAQVLVAGDGTIEVHNLWGLRLLSQDDGQTLRLPLPDGLGSVCVEMVADVVESTTIYDPYGNLLARTGTSTTTYGFTGEQHDEPTGLLYLRARYYNPALRSFMGKDAWSGNRGRPQSMNGWSYVENNPVNLTDPTGLFPNYCKSLNSEWQYVTCVALSYLVTPPWGPWGLTPSTLKDYKYNGDAYPEGILGSPGCFYGAVPYRGSGYLEGTQVNLLAFWLGRETVYDFPTLQRHKFNYIGAGLNDSLGLQIAVAQSAGVIHGFRSWKNIIDDYSGVFLVGTAGVGTNFGVPAGVGIGKSAFAGFPDFTVHGTSWYVGASAGFDALPILEIGAGALIYRPDLTTPPKSYVKDDNTVKLGELLDDITYGNESGFVYDFSVLGLNPNIHAHLSRLFALPRAVKYARVYEGMHGPDSLKP